MQNLKADYIENFAWKDETQINKQTNTKISLVYIFLFQEISKTRILFPFPFCNLKNTSQDALLLTSISRSITFEPPICCVQYNDKE